jgi:hypothetical protein
VAVAAIPDAKHTPPPGPSGPTPSSEARHASRFVRVGFPVRAYSYPLCSPTAAWAKVEVW